MRVVITAATVSEWMPAFIQLDGLYTGESERLKVQFYQSGVGMLSSAVAFTRLALEDKPDLVIQIGIAGCFNKRIPLGKVVAVKDETLGNVGVEEQGVWKDIFDLKLEKGSYHPFEKRSLPNPWLNKFNLLNLQEVNAITVNEITTHQLRIDQLTKKYKPTLESMEGAALHYVYREMNIPFVQIRAISNYIGERDKANWKMKESIDILNQTIIQYLDKLYKIK